MTSEMLASIYEAIARTARRFAPAAFLAICVLSGGASRGAVVATGATELIAIALLLLLTLNPHYVRTTDQARIVLALAGALLFWIVLQLAPLPPAIWTRLPGRAPVMEGFRILGVNKLSSLPISLTSEETVEGLIRFLPPLALFALVAKSPSRTGNTILIWTVIVLAVASTMLGIAAILEPSVSLFLSGRANSVAPAGIFANVNHQADLDLLAMPFAAVLLSRISLHRALGDTGIGLVLIVSAFVLILIIGVLGSGSMAGYTLLGPVLIASLLIYLNRPMGLRLLAAVLTALAALAALGAWLATSDIPSRLGIAPADSDAMSRTQTFARTFKAIGDYMPFGSGLGSFDRIYPAYENASTVTNVYTAHVHNDYLELALELGLPGLAIVALIIGALLVLCVKSWTGTGPDSRLKKAAAVSLIVVMVHSSVDYPLRTAAIATVAALLAGLLVQSKKTAPLSNSLAAPAHRQILI